MTEIGESMQDICAPIALTCLLPGTIATVIGVASQGFRLSLLLNAVGCEIASTGMEVSSISKGVTMFALMLKQTGTMLQQADSVHSREAVETAKQIADDCNRVFEEIEEMLDRSRTKKVDGTFGPTVPERFKQCFKRHRVTYLLGQLESLKLSLSVMLQILQLGKLMANTSKTDTQEEVLMRTTAIQQERMETQNMVVVRYWQVNKMDRLFEAAEEEEEQSQDHQIGNGERTTDFELLENGGSEASSSTQLTVTSPTEAQSGFPSNQLVKLPIASFGELDQRLHRIKQSPKDMVQVSDEVIDPLLERWTNWHHVREQRHAREASGGSSRFAPSVYNLNEDDEDRPVHQKYPEREESPRGYYIEGQTTDWRKPQSAAARREALKLKKKYTGFQPSVSVDSSDVEDSPGSKGSKKRSTKRHVINSSSDTESSDAPEPTKDTRRRRRSSGSPTTEKKQPRFPEGPPLSQSYNQPGSSYVPKFTVSPGSTPRSSVSNPAPPYSPYIPHRPGAMPYQHPPPGMHHSNSSPLPPIHTSNAPLPHSAATYTSAMPQVSPYAMMPGQQYTPVPRYIPTQANRMQVPTNIRPGSRDGARSPNRLSGEYAHSERSHGTGRSSKHRTPEQIRADKERTKKNMKEGATKGLLSVGAIAGFLDALEGLSI